jgi:phosphoesterase RecJ-like protein
MIWNELKELINANHRFLISSHLSLDGDSVGSQLAFYWYLKSLGKDVEIYTHDPVPAKFRFLNNSSMVKNTKPEGSFDVLAVLDCSNLGRLGWTGQDSIAKHIIDIDHHRDNSRFGDVNIVQTDAAATGELIFQLLKSCDSEFPPYVAEALYTAIMTDTGGFRFSNTNSRILRICADLADKGADCAKIYQKVYSSHSQHALLLQSHIWSSLKFYFDGKLCCMEMPFSVLEKLGAQYGDSEGMADYTTTAEGVEVGILVKYTDNETHVSLRSKGCIDVGKIAQKVKGGGGHSAAAGCTIPLPYETAFPQILKIIEQELC